MCRRAALEESALDRARGRIFLNTRPESLAEPVWRRRGAGEGEDGIPLPSSRVVVEVSERSIADDVARVAASREALREAGYGLSLDDVGTGYESLLTVERVRPDFVKVDPMLVHGIEDNLVQQELFASLAEAARRVGAEVVALGVESEAEAETVRALGASLAQGFAFGRPAALAELLADGAPGGNAS
jgi:EAL domain-containing protein (putative c-di-GMP-specific phosphodiesterase class I)